jgi:hypothetical protein
MLSLFMDAESATARDPRATGLYPRDAFPDLPPPSA